LPGVALVILRTSAAILLVAGPTSAFSLPLWAILGLMLLAAGLVLGLLTRLLATLNVLVSILIWLRLGGPSGMLSALHGLDAAALSMLGAGAYSLDASLFGRRVIRLDG
jgi:hypothetical protein